MWDTILEYLAQRLKEPSTYVSLGALGTAIGWRVSPENWNAIATFCMGAGGLLGMILTERKKTSPTEIKNVVEAVVKPQALEPVKPSEPQLQEAMKGNGK